MAKHKTGQEQFRQLRNKAERVIKEKKHPLSPAVAEDPLKLIHELQTFQIELEMQNEALRSSQEALIESEQKYTQLYDFAPVGYISLSSKGVILKSNLTFAQMLSMERVDLTNQPLSAHILFEDQDIYYHYLQALFDSRTRQVCELRLTKKDGTPVDVQLEAVICFDQDNHLLEYRTVVIDISHQKQVEKEKEKLESQLYQTKKMETLGNLAGGIAHDFNNILFIILGNTELALRDTPKNSPVHANLERINAAGVRGAGIVQLLLNYSRRADQKLKPIAISTVIKDAIKSLRSEIPVTIEIQDHLGAIDAKIIADPLQINQVIMNLCLNAFQAMEHSGGVVEIRGDIVMLDDKECHDYPDLPPGEYVKIIVTDTGQGIDPDIIDQVFDPYFTTKAFGKVSGMGLGLSVVLGIVKNHGGAITLDSPPGKGAVFTILFPVVIQKVP